MLQNKDLLTIAKEFGTPLYVYDTYSIKKQYERLITAFKNVSKLKINYAAKALSNITILKFIKKLGSGLDTVSIQEVKLGLIAGFKAGEIIYTPNGVSFNEIAEVAKMGVQINIDNISILKEFGEKYKSIPVCIRINPHVDAGGNYKISVGHEDSKFGISINQIPILLTIISNTKIKINGIHMHTGSDVLDINDFLNASDILLKHAMYFKDLDFIDFGGGFKVPYKPGDIETNINELGNKLADRFNSFCKSYGKKIDFILEPGKFLVSDAGYFLTSVNVVKQTNSTIFVHLNSGFNHLIRPMYYDSYHHIENISNIGGKKKIYTVVGYICETDTFGKNREIEKISKGDVLVFKNAGAYCFTMASNYNSRPRPSEVLWHNNKSLLIREEEDFDDILNKQLDVELD